MRFSPTKFLHGLLCTTPILVLTLAACGGGGGGSSSAPVGAAYTVGGTVSGVSAAGLVLRNNGGDDKVISSADATYTFSTSVVAATSYKVTVLTNPSSPTIQKCTVANASGTMPAYNVTNANVTCVTGYTVGGISGSITGLTGTGLVLQNNGGDNLLISAGSIGPFTFNTPLASGDPYNITVLTQPHNPDQSCSATGNSNIGSANVNTVTVLCNPASPPPDPYIYVANNSSNNVSTYISTSGALSATASVATGSGPAAIVVDPASKYAYVANSSANTLSVYSISSGVLTPLTDVDAGTTGIQTSIPTGTHPSSIAIHPSGKFAYVTNYISNSISAYSIDAATGALSRIDANGSASGTDIATGSNTGPIAITIDPAGNFAYVVKALSGNVSVYGIDGTSGVLTLTDADGGILGTQNSILAGITPYSITIDPAGSYAYVVNSGSTGVGGVSAFQINLDGSLSDVVPGSPFTTGKGPHAIAIHPAGGYAYVVNSGDDTVWIYSIWGGVLTPVGPAPTGSQPLSISIGSTGQHAYVVNSGSTGIGGISTYSISAGALTPVVSSPFDTGSHPYAVTTSR